MIEFLMAWFCLAIAFATKDSHMMIASSVFAVATQIYLMRKGR